MLAPAATRFSAEWRPLAGLGEIADAWRGLCARAAEPNAFYEPAFALAAAPVFGRDVGAVLVWSPDARLVGLFPLRIVRRRYGLPLPLLMGWTHQYGPLGTPLVDRDRVVDVVAAFLDHVAGAASLPELLLMPDLAADGAVARAITAEVTRRGGCETDFEPRQRALLAPSGKAEAYLDASLGGKKRRDLARQRRRLAESGPLTCDIETAPARVAPLFAEFLALEQAGWKGRAGTAAAQRADVAKFMSDAIAGLAREGKAMAASLRRNGGAVATMLVIRSGCGAWAWKIAYDEAAARFSPGVQVLLDMTERLIGEPSVAWADSCATPDHPMIDHIWRERLAVVDRMIALTPEGGRLMVLARPLEGLRRRAIALAKRLRDRLRGV